MVGATQPTGVNGSHIPNQQQGLVGEGDVQVNEEYDDAVDAALKKQLGEKRQLLGTPGHSPSDVDGGIYDDSGAPAIDGVKFSFSADDMALTIQALQNKMQQQQLHTAKEGIKLSKTQIDQSNAKSMSKIEDWIQKSNDAAAKAKKKSIFGWLSIVGSVLACVVAVAATVATGGLASPLLAVAVIGVASLAYTAGKMVLEKTTGVKGELSDLFTFVAKKAMQILPIPEEKREAVAKVVGCGLALLATGGASLALDPGVFGQLAGGTVGLFTNSEKVLSMVTMVTTAIAAVAVGIAMAAMTGGGGSAKALSGVISAIGTIGTAGAQIGNGAIDLQIAKDVKEGELAQADRKEIDAFLMKLQQLMEEDTEQLKKVLQEIEDGFSSISQILSNSAASRSQIIGNIRPAMA